MNKKNEKSIINAILTYEQNFYGALIRGYHNKQEFVNDLTKALFVNEEVKEIIQFYKIMLNCSNETNSTKEKIKALNELILILEGYDFNFSLN